jgi:uncharacterized protein (DUF2236 family)
MAVEEVRSPAGSVFPAEGEAAGLLVGPGSAAWRYGSDPRLYFGMLYPLLLQVADPVVGAGVRDYSDFRRRPWDRLIGTLDYVALLIYGGEDAIAAGRRLRALHKGFRGTREDGQPYYALDRQAYAWVHATLIEAYVSGHRHFGSPMSESDRECFYAEYRDLGRFVGIRPGELPGDWAAFHDYFQDYARSRLTRTSSVDTVLATVDDPAAPVPMPAPVWRALRVAPRRGLMVGGLGLMAPWLREQLDIPWSERDERHFQAVGRATRRLTPLMPESARVVGPLQLRLRRRGIARGPLGDEHG